MFYYLLSGVKLVCLFSRFSNGITMEMYVFRHEFQVDIRFVREQ